MNKKKVLLRPVASIPTIEVGGNLVALNVGPDGVVYAAFALRSLDYTEERSSGVVFPKTEPANPQRYRVVGMRGSDRVVDVLIDSERFNIHDVQPLGDDILLACHRSHYRGPQDFDRNGRIYGKDGSMRQEILLGDGIASMQVTARGEIWTSYFDEGVYGNFGWQSPVGSAGLIAWNQQGGKEYEYDPSGLADVIDDCYALNVASDDDVWCYYYSDFPLVHIHKRRIAEVWKIPVTGSHAFAVGSGLALFGGDYRDRQLLSLVALQPDGGVKPLSQIEPCDEKGEPMEVGKMVGRADSLYLLCGDNVYQAQIGKVL